MISVNLIPSEVLIRHAVKRRIWRWAVACVLLAGAALVPVVIEARQQAQVERLKLKFMDMEGQVSGLRGQLSATAQTVLDLDAELARAHALRTKRSWSGLLALLSACLPQEVWLTSVATDPPQPKASGAPSPRSRVKTGDPGARDPDGGGVGGADQTAAGRLRAEPRASLRSDVRAEGIRLVFSGEAGERRRGTGAARARGSLCAELRMVKTIADC